MRRDSILWAVLIFLGTILVANSQTGKNEYDVTLTWRDATISEAMEEIKQHPSAVATPVFIYFWNGESLGANRKGLREIYQRLRAKDHLKILINSRSMDGEGGHHDGCILKAPVWNKFNELFRKKDFEVTIKYSKDEKDNIGLPDENPFNDS